VRPLLKEPTRRVLEMMAEIEQRESGDEGRAREWMARALRAPRDPEWTADGYVSDRWMPVSPVSGRLDAFQWKVPLSELGDARETIDAAELAELAKPVELAKPPVIASIEPAPAQPAPIAPTPPVVARPDETIRTAEPVLSPPPPVPRVEAVIPLIHVPDDPGPEPVADLEPEPEPSTGRGGRLFK
jgi:HemY protein